MLRRTLLMMLMMMTAVLFAWPAEAQQTSLDDVLNSYYEAIGGLEAWKSLESLKATGKMTMGQGVEAPFTMVAERPGKVRIDFTFQGMTGTQAFDGSTAWMVRPFAEKTEPEEMPADLAKNIRDQADIDGPLVGYKDSGHQLELVGLEETEGTKAYKLKLTRPSGDIEYYYLNAESYLPIKVEATRQVRGTEMQFETLFSNYKDVDGRMIAHSIESRAMGQVVTVDRFEVNTDIPDATFAMPTTAAANH